MASRKPKIPLEPVATCGNCRHIRPAGDLLYCHRYPPTAIRGDDGAMYSEFPIVQATDTCGEFAAKLNS